MVYEDVKKLLFKKGVNVHGRFVLPGARENHGNKTTKKWSPLSCGKEELGDDRLWNTLSPRLLLVP